MHGEDHRRCRTCLTEPVARVCDIAKAHALAAELDRHQKTQQAIFTDGFDRSGGETSFCIDGIGISSSDFGDGLKRIFNSAAGVAAWSGSWRAWALRPVITDPFQIGVSRDFRAFYREEFKQTVCLVYDYASRRH